MKAISGVVKGLDEVICDQLLSRGPHLKLLLKLYKRFLRGLYIDASLILEAVVWKKFNKEIGDHFDLICAYAHGYGIAFEQNRRFFEIAGLTTKAPLYNPIWEIEKQLAQPIGREPKALTHGDLQSTNVLVALDRRQEPEFIGVIDIEKMTPNNFIVDDLVRIEADFWRSIFTAVARKFLTSAGQPEEEVITTTMAAIVLAIDALDGREPRIDLPKNHLAWRLANAAGEFVLEVRKMVWEQLHTGMGAKEYFPSSYMVAVRCTTSRRYFGPSYTKTNSDFTR